jgi:hypothetical protein
VDEQIQVEDSPCRAARIKEEAIAAAKARRAAAMGKSVEISTDESLRLASEIGAKAASDAATADSRASE